MIGISAVAKNIQMRRSAHDYWGGCNLSVQDKSVQIADNGSDVQVDQSALVQQCQKHETDEEE